jgi:hypothetical protein
MWLLGEWRVVRNGYFDESLDLMVFGTDRGLLRVPTPRIWLK